MGALSGHWWTFAPHVRGLLAGATGRARARGHATTITVEDPSRGSVPLRCVWHPADSGAVVVVVHGLGGSADSVYMHRAVEACARAGVSCLLVSLRGAALDGVDFYHAGLWSDLEVVLRSKLLERPRRRLLLGYSLGGHLCLGLAAHRPDLVDACAAVCSPLDLDAGASVLDTLRPKIYRRHVLDGLKEMYCTPNATHAMPTPAVDVARVETVRAFDSLTIVPRFGFADVSEYYARASVGPLLPTLETPSLYVQAVHDPMVPPRSTDPSLAKASAALTVVRVDPGGHVGFPSSMRLVTHGGPTLPQAPSGLEAQCVAWLLARGDPRSSS